MEGGRSPSASLLQLVLNLNLLEMTLVLLLDTILVHLINTVELPKSNTRHALRVAIIMGVVFN